jgi:hypothetical protein
MTRLIMVGCAAVLLAAAAMAVRAQETRDATTPAPAVGAATGVPATAPAWNPTAAGASGSSGATVAGSDDLVPGAPANPWNTTGGGYPVPTVPGEAPPYPYQLPGGSNWVYPGASSAGPIHLDPETAQLLQADRNLGGKINALAATYKDLTDDAKRADAEKELSMMVTDQFGIRQKLREKQLAALDDQLKRLRTLHGQRNEQRERIVTDRVQQVLRDATGLGWGEVGAGIEFGFKFKTGDPGALLPETSTGPRRATTIRKVRSGNGETTIETSSEAGTSPAPPK